MILEVGSIDFCRIFGLCLSRGFPGARATGREDGIASRGGELVFSYKDNKHTYIMFLVYFVYVLHHIF